LDKPTKKMPQTLCEYIRKNSVESCFSLKAFTSGWITWKSQISSILGNRYNENDIFNLGDHLADIFATTGKPGRGQSEVSGGGYGWEGLVCWYLNLCLAGTRGVVLRKASDSPLPLRDAISVNYGNFRSNTESDITVIIFPDQVPFTAGIETLIVLDSQGNTIPLKKNGKFNLSPIIDNLTEIHFRQIELGIVQCKTNWNDNAQIPMLWSMIYESTNFKNSSISVGANGFSIKYLDKFSYSFCTVPTNDLGNYNPNSTSVNRVRNLTGRNYWGHPTRNGVAFSIKEIFNNNFSSAYSADHRSTIKNTLSLKNTDFNYFDLP
jgi:hypothetical protein